MTYVTRDCVQCGRSFDVLLKYARHPGRGIFCSRSCLTISKNRRRKGQPLGRDVSGENNPNWKGGVSASPYRYKRRFAEKSPEKVLAHRLVQKAIQSGRLTPEPCAHCGSGDRIHAHHTDYSKPLEVTWLCMSCHIQEHVRLAREAA